MKKLFGNISGLKANHIKRLENLYRRKVPPESIISPELAKDLCQLSSEIRRQIGLLINRLGKIDFVIIGDNQGIVIPETSQYKAAPGRLKGLRCVHTHLKQDEILSLDDLTDLALLRLDLMVAISINAKGIPHLFYSAHILPPSIDNTPYQILEPKMINELNVDCGQFIAELEKEIGNLTSRASFKESKEQAFLVSVSNQPVKIIQDSLLELAELSNSNQIVIIDTIIQHRKKIDPKFVMGFGKLKELTILALQKGATMLIFDQELTAAQIRSITDKIALKVIDRTQLILDIFAQRAQSREGKLQVELAQLQYLMPRLITKNTAMSRLTGGIGGRGPGETKLEINRRRARERIKQVENDLLRVRKNRKTQRTRRNKKGLPTISIVGYTNAGKSTLLNTLTKSNVLAEKRAFATLDPSSRRLKFPQDVEVIITDTVGFIRNLPQELISAFKATLEELESADILLHLVDISAPDYQNQIDAVEKILTDLNLDQTPCLYVFNKVDLTTPDFCQSISRQMEGVFISANNSLTLTPLITTLNNLIQNLNGI